MSMPSALRVAILGAESTGKSTLAAALAARYNTFWVTEFLREFVESNQRTPQEEEQFFIAATQVAHEARLIKVARSFLFCDTTPLMTELYSRFYFGRVDAALETLSSSHAYDFTIVTCPDSPWEPDGLQRESDQVRQAIHDQLLGMLNERAIPFLLAHGSLEERVQQVASYLPQK